VSALRSLHRYIRERRHQCHQEGPRAAKQQVQPAQLGGGVNAILDTFIMLVLHNVGDSITLSHAWTNLYTVGCGRNSVDQLSAASKPHRPMAGAFYHKPEAAVQRPTAWFTASCARVRRGTAEFRPDAAGGNDAFALRRPAVLCDKPASTITAMWWWRRRRGFLRVFRGACRREASDFAQRINMKYFSSAMPWVACPMMESHSHL